MLPARALAPTAADARALRRVFALSLFVGAAQCALAWRSDNLEFALTATIAWVAALTVAFDRGLSIGSKQPRAVQAFGSLLAVAASWALSVTPYRAVDRLMPLLAGIGVALAASGATGVLARWRELAFLALTVVNPMPRPVRMLIGPTRLTAFCAMAIDRLLGHTVSLDGDVLQSPTATLDVMPECSGVNGIMRLCALAALVIALFPMGTKRKIGVFAAAVAVGFATNVPRIALLAIVLTRGEDDRFFYWHEGRGATVFSVLSTAVAVLVWWLLLRRGGERPRSAAVA